MENDWNRWKPQGWFVDLIKCSNIILMLEIRVAGRGGVTDFARVYIMKSFIIILRDWIEEKS